MFLSVILPSYNEQVNAQSGSLEAVWQYLSSQKYSWELILSDDGSTDGTAETLEQFAKSHKSVRVLQNSHKGKGPTVVAGLENATGEWRLFSDFDQATPIVEIEKLLPFTKQGYDVVIGSREIAGSKRQKEPFHRHLMGKGFNFFVRLFTISGIDDTQCGFKLFSKRAVDELCPRIYIYSGKGNSKGAFTGAFDVELLFLAKKFGFTIAEVPVIWKYVKTNRVDPIKDSAKMFVDLLRIRFADLTGKYNSKS